MVRFFFMGTKMMLVKTCFFGLQYLLSVLHCLKVRGASEIFK